MAHKWTAEDIQKLAEFPTAIWWLMEKAAEDSSLCDFLELCGLPLDACFGKTLRETSATDIFRTGASESEPPGSGSLGAIPPNIRKRLVELAGNDGMAAPILAHDSVCAKECPIVPPDDQPDVSEKTIVIGVIDDTIALANHRFKNHDGTTRFAHFWQQDAACVCRQSSGKKGTKVRFGREYSFTEIDAACKSASSGGQVDEQTVYRLLGMDLPLTREPNRFGRTLSHGTHIADLAGGMSPLGPDTTDDPLSDADPRDVLLIGVNLPTSVVADTAGTFFEVTAILGIARILEHVRLMEEKWRASHPDAEPISIPVVINLSFALMGGGRKGSALLERYMDFCVKQRTGAAPLRFVLPAGNHYMERLVGTYTVPDRGGTEVLVRVAPDSRASTFVELRLADPGEEPRKSRLVAEVVPPFEMKLTTDHGGFDPSKVVSVDMYQMWLLSDDGSEPAHKCAVFYSWRPDLTDTAAGKKPGYETITVAIPPTWSENEKRRLPPPGIWTIRLRQGRTSRSRPAGDVAVNVRVLRNDIPTLADPLPQRSRLEDPHYLPYDSSGFPNQALVDPGSPILRERTINTIATGSETIVVGALRDSDGLFANYSAAGPIDGTKSDGSNEGIIVTTIGDDGLTVPGVRASGTASGSSVRLSGTSVAVPQVTRIVVGQLRWWHDTRDPDLGSITWLKALAAQNAFGPTKPAVRAGAGGIRSRRRPVW
jgi:hypothetical protein